MARPKGTPNKPGYRRPGPRPERTRIMPAQYDPDEILRGKLGILALLEAGEVTTIAGAARKLQILPARAHQWAKEDTEFSEMVKMAREVAADDIEEGLRRNKHFIPQMFLLKGYRPMFRENFRVDLQSETLEKLLEELKDIGQKSNQEAT